MEQYTISTGRSRLEKQWQPKSVTWQTLTEHLAKPRITGELYADYMAMPKAQKGAIKDIGGFVGGGLKDGHRKAECVALRTLLTLDIDYGRPDTLETVTDMLAGTAWCIYSTHSHRPEAPRFRLVIPLSREVTPDEYIPIARRIAEKIGIDIFDDSTYQPERLMYWPSVARDGEFVFETGEGAPVDADAVLNTYADWRNVLDWPVSKRVQRIATRASKHQEDPCQKDGIIGAFCRCYSISEAITTFLPDVYAPTDDPNRYTFINGSTEAGAIVYEDKFLYSHHGTDPCCEREVNAFDMVRLHRFSAEDEDAKPDTPFNRLPSVTAMVKFASEDSGVRKLMAKEKISSLNSASGDFNGISLDNEEGDGPDWEGLLDMNVKTKQILPTAKNLGIICRNDAGLKNKVRMDVFKGRQTLVADLPWRSMDEGIYWTNSDDLSLLEYISIHYDIQNKTVILDTMEGTVARNWFHPVKDYLDRLPDWDGTPRIDSLLIDYLGADDNALTRAMTRKHLTAAVARIYEPGCKYDYVLTLTGPEGIGKSTIIRKLHQGWFDDSFSTADIGSKEAMEQIRGRWGIEMGELKDYKKATVEAFKAFVSKQEDNYRPAYGRKTEHFQRQCVFYATTNERAFLKGDTGNRRFWAVEVMTNKPKLDVFGLTQQTIDQIWAEAIVRYKAGESLFLDRDMEFQARARQAEYNEITTDERVGIIEAALRRHLPCNWWSLNKQQRRMFFKDTAYLADNEPFILRETICAAEVQEEIFGVPGDRYKNREINQILQSLGFVSIGVCRSPRDKEYGLQRRFQIPSEFFGDDGNGGPVE